jgi:hypothetical protein
MVLLSLTRFGGEFFAKLAGIVGMLVRLHGQLVSSQMIFLVMGGGGGRVGMGGKVMELGDPSVRALWHGLLLILSMSELPYGILAGASQAMDHVILHENESTYCCEWPGARTLIEVGGMTS